MIFYYEKQKYTKTAVLLQNHTVTTTILLQNATDITKIDVIRKCICRQYEYDLPYTYPEWMLLIGYNKKEAKYNQVNLHANYFMHELNENNLETPGINLIIWKNTSSSFFGLTYA